jgi:dephospho-CoA kinase
LRSNVHGVEVRPVVKRVELYFAPGVIVEFVDRDRGVRQVYEIGERGTRLPIVVFGPEGCGKSAWLKQATGILRELDYDVIYIDILHKELVVHTDVKEVVKRVSDITAEISGLSVIKLADLVLVLADELLKRWRRERIALLVDEVFQAIGVDKAEIYVKMLLNLIEYPPKPYEKIVAIVTTSEGVSRRKIGRHLWAELKPMWNMSKTGFEELYSKIPGDKPPFEETWRLTGGNPRTLSLLYQVNWKSGVIVEELIRSKELTREFIDKWRRWLEVIVDDIDAVSNADFPSELREELIARNLIVYNLYERDPAFWIDEHPPRKDLEIGVGREVAWQTPLHREAVKRALERYE